MIETIKSTFRLLLFILPALLPADLARGQKDALEAALETKVKAQEERRKSQEAIDGLATETRDLLQKYSDITRKSDQLSAYNQQLSKLIKQQSRSLDSIQRQLDNIEETRRNIVPLISKMVDTLEKFISLDLPFLVKERQQRVTKLKKIMDRPDVTLSEKYRRIMEAYRIEVEYGRTIEAYNDAIEIDGREYTVDILRVGRLLIVFQTLDGKLSGVWNKQSKLWEKLPDKFSRSIRQGLKIAKKQAPPELIKLPVNTADSS